MNVGEYAHPVAGCATPSQVRQWMVAGSFMSEAVAVAVPDWEARWQGRAYLEGEIPIQGAVSPGPDAAAGGGGYFGP